MENVIQSISRNKLLKGGSGIRSGSLIRLSKIRVDWCPFVVSYCMDPAKRRNLEAGVAEKGQAMGLGVD